MRDEVLIVVYSYHHGNTEKIARVFSEVLGASITTPQDIVLEEMSTYRLVGFGSGIYDGKHHDLLLDLAERLPRVDATKAFIFSTCGVPAFAFGAEEIEKYIENNHSPLREKLEQRGYTIVDEFCCTGFNTNSFLKLWGGINKGRPNADDLGRAKAAAQNLKSLVFEPFLQ
jgi:flavodoxin